MREMKDSGVEWIGKIPCLWNKNPIRNIVVSRDGGAWGEEPDENNVGTICLRIADFDYEKGEFKSTAVEELTHRIFSDAQIYRLRLKKNDILVEKSGGGEKTPVGRTVIFNKDYEALFANFMDRLKIDAKSVTSLFVEYWFRALYACRVTPFYIKQTTGIQNLDLSMMLAKEKIFFPTINQQDKITNYLNNKCSEIDALTADIQAQIDVLEQYKRSVITEAVTKGLNPDAEMKDSDVRWIGQMPAHWECIRGKYILRYLQKPIRDDDGVITCFRDGEVTLRSNRREDGFTMSDKEIGYQGIDVGDLVVHGMDGFAGSIGISDSRGKASPVLNVLDTKQNKRYVMYYLRSMAYSDVFVAMATGIRVRSCDLRWNKLSELQYPVPPLDEQEKIVNHIDAVLQRTNDVIADKQSQLATLDEYKKSLIFEYVTGKKEVSVL